ncbi:MAG: hypothetical protein CVT67_06170 [Actinobacteria bacterium HGW-Actinobacteria-7]|nr:MAG: hypothetical protein CVT67_06170 [Actinobacteria bacterium HGW-Actinobacteria-7]
MALRGNLRDFSLPDVFQLVTFSRKTGVLRIVREDQAEGSVWFREGDVFFASSNWHADPLGQRLVNAQRLTPQALNRALELRSREAAEGRRLGQILIDEGYITDKVLESFVSEQIQDTIFDLMRWEDGDFDFEAMPEVVDEDIGLTVSIENVVMEGSRRLEEWGRIKKKIPSTDVVFKMATAPGEGTFEISLKPIEWQLLLLIDGTRSVAEMATETGRTDFEVARIVYGLFSAGLLEFATDEEIKHNREERTSREVKLAEIAAEELRVREAAHAAELEREEALAADARRRQQEESAAAPAAPVSEFDTLGADAGVDATPGPAEEPEFLTEGAVASSADDQAALDEFMGAVLSVSDATSSGASVQKSDEKSAPYVPVEEPAFISAGRDVAAEDEFAQAPSVEELLGITPLAEPAGAVEDMRSAQAEELAVDLGVEPFERSAELASEMLAAEPSVPEFLPELIVERAADEPDDLFMSPIVPEPIEGEMEAAVEPLGLQPPEGPSSIAGEPFVPVVPESDVAEFVPVPAAIDFERDLMALGLGELPPDLLGADFQVEPRPIAGGTADMGSPTFVELSDETELVFDTESEGAPRYLAGDDLAPPVSEPMSEVPVWVAGPDSVPGAEQPAPFIEPQSVESDGSIVDGSVSRYVIDEGPEDGMDFSALIESLDVDADEAGSLAASAGFDAELLRDEATALAGGVISTDAFLEDIVIEELGFSGGLTDELSALTGAQRRPAQRPQASVNAIPEEGTGLLQRDVRVDRDTLLKIIDGIKKL